MPEKAKAFKLGLTLSVWLAEIATGERQTAVAIPCLPKSTDRSYELREFGTLRPPTSSGSMRDGLMNRPSCLKVMHLTASLLILLMRERG